MIEQILNQGRFFAPSNALAALIDVRQNNLAVRDAASELGDQYEAFIPVLAAVYERTEQENEAASQMSRYISEQLYHLLAALARSSEAITRSNISLWNAVSLGMTSALGLMEDVDDEPKVDHLVGDLMVEFKQWLNNVELCVYQAPWGEIHLDDDKLVLFSSAAISRAHSPAELAVAATPDSTGYKRSWEKKYQDVNTGPSKATSGS